MDDLLIYTKGNLSDHKNVLDYVFNKMRHTNLTGNPTKMQLAKSKIKFMGHIISKNSVQIDPDRVSAILKTPKPKTTGKLYWLHIILFKIFTINIRYFITFE